MELFQSPPPKKKNLRQTDSRWRVGQPIGWIDKRESYVGINGIEIFLGGGEQLHGSFSDVGAHQDFQMPEFFMPELRYNV